MKPSTMVPVLHLALLLLVSPQVFGYDGVHEIFNKEKLHNSTKDVGFHANVGAHFQIQSVSSFLLRVSRFQSSLSDLIHRSQKAIAVLFTSSNANNLSLASPSYYAGTKSGKKRPHFHHITFMNPGNSTHSARIPPLVTPAASHYVKSLLPTPQPNSALQASPTYHFNALLSESPPPLPQPSREPTPPPPPLPRRKHHRKHHHHSPPPPGKSGAHPQRMSPPMLPRGPPLQFPWRSPPPPFPRIPRGPHLLSPPPSPKHSNSRSPPPRPSPPFPGSLSPPPPSSHSNTPTSPPQGHGISPPSVPRKRTPPATPPLSPPPPVESRPSPSSPPAAPKQSSPPPPVKPKPSPSPPPAAANPPPPVAPKPLSPPPPAAFKPLSPPPPSEDCSTIVCLPPLTKTPFMSPCGCVRPIQVRIELTVPLYSLFPLISVLAANLAEGTVLSPNQVEVIGANADSQNPDYSVVDVNLVPLDQGFDNLTALIIFEKFWKHELLLNSTLFGNYSVVYVQYPGLPASPPSENTPGGQSGAPLKQNPVGVVVKSKSHNLGVGTIAVIALSSAIALVVCLGAVWLLLLKLGCCKGMSPPAETGPVVSARTRRSGIRSALSSDLGSTTSMSFTSSITTYANTARTFTFAELDKATDRFRPENVIGEGGFGRVYSGILDDGTKVAVKVLTRDDQHGGKEFIAEVEMLSRLHHRNLVKLIGICTEEHNRCLVYELIPNGSVDSHLHGADREVSPLDWEARMKIALGAARGLAYLHEDSNPRVIHRDFKASNILLENDFNPKVSDFGLAKAAPDEGSGHLSTRVMGTFGYVAPEYAMTGHLLVKSDVYSYGVVLLELLSGRKPVDMSQPPGQENLVTWARPLLTSKEGLELLVDPALEGNFPLDNLVKVAAIASMCVQPEVSHRPFMGEVVQALKLVYNDADVHNGNRSSNDSQLDDSLAESDMRAGIRRGWVEQKASYLPDNTSFISIDYDSGPSHAGGSIARRPLSASAIFSNSARFLRRQSNSFRRHSLSGPLRVSRSRLSGYQQRRANKQGSISEDATLSRRISSG
eukprot:c24262_g1_i1 orf=980-4132(+)